MRVEHRAARYEELEDQDGGWLERIIYGLVFMDTCVYGLVFMDLDLWTQRASMDLGSDA